MSEYKRLTAFLTRKAKECESETYLDILSLIWHLRYSIRKEVVMEIFFRLNENETNKDINNFTLAYNIYKECEKIPQLNARVVADMILRQCTEDDFQASFLYASGERQGE